MRDIGKERSRQTAQDAGKAGAKARASIPIPPHSPVQKEPEGKRQNGKKKEYFGDERKNGA